jgi:adenylate cyclase
MVDAFFNEAVFCIFGAPIDEREHPAMACKAALGGLRETVKLAAEWSVKGFAKIKASIGIATGQCIVGNFGSEERMMYTAIGDLVNYCEQLRAHTRLYGAPIVISRETAEAARGRMLVRELDIVRGAGEKKHAPIFELMGPLETATPSMRDAVHAYERGLDLYRRREWEQAVSYFGDVSRLIGEDGPSRLFIRRCEHYLRHAPPPQWDGVHSPSMRIADIQ